MKLTPVAVLLALALAPAIAAAGNGQHPRTPVLWTDAPCMTVIDRSQGAIHPLSYDIPYEDTDVTPDEVVDSRTHQFFAFCRDRHLEDILPGWITEAEVAMAGAAGLGDPAIVDLELDVLENAPDWAGCWVRITGDDERRPITFAAAAEPVMWDTGMLAAGAWVVDGFTYEPWNNMWSPHPGVFKIVDDPEPAASGPAAALSFGELLITYPEETTITGCVDAMDGSTMTLSWSNGNINGAPSWQVFAADIPAQTGAFELPFAPPPETISNTVMIRLDIVDPMNREWTAYSRAYISVVEDNSGSDGCEDGGGFVSDPCDTGTDGGTGTESNSGESGPPLADEGETGGCACAAGDSGRGSGAGSLAWLLAGLALVRRRRRREFSSRQAASGPSARC